MIKQWYTIQVKYMKVDDNGNESMVKESYFLNAYNYTHAESRSHEEMEQRVRGEFRIEQVTKTNFESLVMHEEFFDSFFKVKVKVNDYDPDYDKQKTYTSELLVNASTIEDSIKFADDLYSNNGVDFKIIGSTITPILDAFEQDLDFLNYEVEEAKSKRESSPQVDLLDEIEKEEGHAENTEN